MHPGYYLRGGRKIPSKFLIAGCSRASQLLIEKVLPGQIAKEGRAGDFPCERLKYSKRAFGRNQKDFDGDLNILKSAQCGTSSERSMLTLSVARCTNVNTTRYLVDSIK